jgi:hypothetical protein
VRQDGGRRLRPYGPRVCLGFQHRVEADRFLADFQERLQKFGLELHLDKTRRIEFGKFAEQNRNHRGEGKPETFDFLGFTHISGKDQNGNFAVKRKTISKRMRAKASMSYSKKATPSRQVLWLASKRRRTM